MSTDHPAVELSYQLALASSFMVQDVNNNQHLCNLPWSNDSEITIETDLMDLIYKNKYSC